MGFIKAVTDNEFEENVLQSVLPVLVVFHVTDSEKNKYAAIPANWAKDFYKGRLEVCSFNLDLNPNFHNKYGMKEIPSIAFFWWGEVYASFACNELTTQDIIRVTLEKIDKEGVTREPYPCKLCKTKEAFGSRYLKRDKKRKEYDVCMTCAMEERKRLATEFESTLLPEQRELYKKYTAAESRVSSIFILD